MTEPTVLVVEHEADAPAGWMGDGLTDRGTHLEVCRPYAGDAVPGIEGYDGLVVLGGAMDAWDDAETPWLPATRELVRSAESAGVPTFGICLGHQVATLALGGEVGRNPAGTTAAVLPIAWGDEAFDDPLLGSVTDAAHALHWNNDIVLRLPDGAQVLALSPDGAVQAARLGEHVWGVQFHPEATPEILASWVAEYAGPEADLDGYLAEAERLRADLEETCRRLAGSFHRLVTGSER